MAHRIIEILRNHKVDTTKKDTKGVALVENLYDFLSSGAATDVKPSLSIASMFLTMLEQKRHGLSDMNTRGMALIQKRGTDEITQYDVQ